MTQADELERLGLVAAPEAVAQPLRIAPARVTTDRQQPQMAEL